MYISLNNKSNIQPLSYFTIEALRNIKRAVGVIPRKNVLFKINKSFENFKNEIYATLSSRG